MSKVNLLPSGYFEVTLSDGIVKGRYSAKALKMLSTINGGLSFSNTWALLAGSRSTIENYLQLVMCAIKSEGGEADEFRVLEILEELGGMTSDESQSLFAHFMEGFVPKKKVEQNGISHGVNS
jgi:hypothetical protein